MHKYIFLFLFFITTSGMAYNEACLSIYGFVVDATSQRPIEQATIMVRLQNTVKTVSSTKVGGRFIALIPCDAKSILVEASGYRALTLPIQFTTETDADKSFYVSFSMTASDKQAVNRPYLQSEQKHYVLQTESATAISLTRSFQTVDAITGKALEASVCFQYTRTGQRNCQTLTLQQSQHRVRFKEPDIVAIEVTAAGYQSYQGNLIIDKLDGSDQVYEIKLSRALTLLSIIVENAASAYQGQLKRGNQSAGYNLKAIDNRHYYSQLPNGGPAIVQFQDASGKVIAEQKMTLLAGLNYSIVRMPPEAIQPVDVLSKALAIQAVESIPDSSVLLFDQSDHILRTDSKQKLDTMAAWLQRNGTGRVQITGHSDNVGDPLRNQTLSEYRARVVARYLLDKGISERQLDWKAVGGNQPALPNDSEQNKIRNRRVVVRVIY